ncbi:uncharacterized protein LOC111050340 [Nilaparvata lugens]|uniref:uncharacterized protein LOC111050340 n=1 Tax=Nilaparvata lugens TaxID=108931 RepID=UPI00193C9E85|nr:uncharacterized protein LOC111050340 [Nilaparvata lugens]
MLDPTTGGLRVPPARQLWAPHPAPTEAAAVYSLFQQQEHQHQTLLAAPRFTTPSAATYPCGTAALLASVHPQKDVITSNYSPITLKPKLAKKRSWDEMVKVEPASAKSPCSCPNGAKKIETAASSRTPPVSLSLVKKEPIGTPTPCQVAEVTTSVRVKQEISESSITTGASGIPVGIAVARQRNLDNGRGRGETPPTPAHHAHATPTLAPPTFLQQQPPLLLAGCDDRSMWSMPHTAPHWQYPPMEPSIPVGFQLVRDPMTGQLLLIPPTTNVAGVMLPCDMASAAKATHMSSASQPLLASNAGLTLIQQLSTLANPTQFSTGSLLIQHISGSNTQE